MKEASEPSKVVSLSQRLDPSSQRGGELLNAVRGIAGRRLQQLLDGMFEHVDDALFDLAEKAENNAAQMHYFDGMREVRKRRPAVERSYLAQVSRELGDIAASQRPAAAEPAPLGNIELTLVADNELEESLAITSMISKNESRLARDLFAVNQRLSVICGGLKIDEGNNPIAPAALSQAFRQAMRELSADMRVKLIIYKLFDRYVLSGLEELYQEINAELIRAGVLPQLRHGIARGGQPARPGAAAAAAALGEQAAAGADDAEMAENLLQTLRQLFSARRGQAHGAAAMADGNAGAAMQAPTVNELLGALSVLQSQLASGPAFPAGAVDTAALGQEVAELKDHLLSQLGALRGERPSQVASIDEDTIDLVGMLFEFILEDDNLPAPMQAMLARLQIPYLKAAILDRRLFANRQHPARRLLDGLAELAKGWSAESDRDHRVHDKVKAIVEQLLHEFDDDMGIFERLCGELQEFQELIRKRAELAEQRVAESTRGRERLEQARRRAAREILDRIGEQTLPPLIHGVLARAWANYLVLTILRQGEDSSEFADALRFVNDFIASTRPARDPESQRQLRQLLPGIERALRRGLASVAFQESDIERLLGQLHAYYRQQLGEAVEEAAPEEPAPLPIPESIQPIVEQEAPALRAEREAPVVPPPDLPELEQVLALKPGTWLEFCPTGEAVERAKLSWISPMSGRYLFVNRRGLKVADYAPHELAAALAAGSARILASEPLFDRAMDAIVGRLSQGLPPAPPAA
ncbi:DUF1631 domain-containing protein [Fulvimonas soli]|uniref:Uncharacterized protein DUF1631 n=1 Tax=Fulvimonas soli TaxID=155197 RepID=A0A316IFK1_9GAMM|nr:DUF1631 domain-containing protein [Fulvimonas soli]PWK92192.1 uncharacterized protein DUF1631 [Fulvimonas soli]TNY27911.1 hypothetical protein BV497_01345 [Fulvimonas soli]